MKVRLTVAVFLLMAGCGGGDEPVAQPCPSVSPVEDVSAIPDAFPVSELTEVIRVRVKHGFLLARGVGETTIVELYPQLSRALLDGGFEILSGDNEGFEAEIFFRKGGRTTGTYLLREGPCEGQVTLNLLYGPIPRRAG